MHLLGLSASIGPLLIDPSPEYTEDLSEDLSDTVIFLK